VQFPVLCAVVSGSASSPDLRTSLIGYPQPKMPEEEKGGRKGRTSVSSCLRRYRWRDGHQLGLLFAEIPYHYSWHTFLACCCSVRSSERHALVTLHMGLRARR
jgi:hypothetical protein